LQKEFNSEYNSERRLQIPFPARPVASRLLQKT